MVKYDKEKIIKNVKERIKWRKTEKYSGVIGMSDAVAGYLECLYDMGIITFSKWNELYKELSGRPLGEDMILTEEYPEYSKEYIL